MWSNITFSFICTTMIRYPDVLLIKKEVSRDLKFHLTPCMDHVHLKSHFQSLGVTNLMGLDDLATFCADVCSEKVH